VGFHKPKRFYGHTITSKEQLYSTSAAFVGRYREVSGIKGEPQAEHVSLHSHITSLSGKLRGAIRRSSAGGSHTVLALGSAGGAAALMQGGHGGHAASSGTHAHAHGSTLPSTSEIQLASSSAHGYGHGHHAPAVAPAALDAGRGGAGAAAVGASGAAAASAALDEALEPAPAPVWATGWWGQYTSCLWRELLAVTRNPADVAGRTLTFSWVALLMGMLYFNMPLDASSLRGRLNLLFNSLVFFCLMPYVSMSLYTADKKFYIADASAKLYRPHAYYAAKVGAAPALAAFWGVEGGGRGGGALGAQLK
jgi:hypothetical protein